MEPRNRLGIYLGKDKATVVLADSHSAGRIVECFGVSLAESPERNYQALAALIARNCAERRLRFSEVAVAIDCALFMQHAVHSEFSDPKKIAATVRFDTEEALATDISDTAIAFQVVLTRPAGSELIVFTVQQKVLSEILLALQSNGLDPLLVEPDIVCLSRLISQKAPLSGGPQNLTLFGVLAGRRGYLVGLSPGGQVRVLRTLLVNAAQDRTRLLTADVRITAAATAGNSAVAALRVFDSAGTVRHEQLGHDLGMDVGPLDLAGMTAGSREVLNQCPDPVGLAIAYGACLAHQAKTEPVNFRSDFMPFQGKRLRLQKAVKVLSLSLMVLLLALGVFFQTQLLQVNKDRSVILHEFEPQFRAVVFGKKDMPAMKDAVKQLGSLLRRIESEKKGLITDQEAVASRLTLVLGAFNNCANATELEIKSVSINAGTIIVDGSTSGRANTLRLFESLKQAGLDIAQQGVLPPKDNRDYFTVTVAPPKKTGQGSS